MAKKAKKKAAKRRRKPRPAEIPELPAPVARRITIATVVEDLLELKAGLVQLL